LNICNIWHVLLQCKMVVGWQRPWMVFKETNVQTSIPIIIFQPYVDRIWIVYWSYMSHMLTVHMCLCWLLHVVCWPNVDHKLIVCWPYIEHKCIYINAQNHYILMRGWWMEMHSGMFNGNARATTKQIVGWNC